tara:strand:+ start:371 stop:499 length:129 start_codon:yes stop_codon:yes gene_type:complete
MKTTYITLAFFAILLVLFILMYFIDIPSPSKIVEEIYTLEVK